ncbi:MAG: metallophosphoesterase family protein [bacterium]|nr:metallophosphoesterase family protein [bacterium]
MTKQTIAIISDIHSNSAALARVLEDIDRKGIDLIFNLGDSVYGPLDPAGTADILMKQDILSIKGNQDRILEEVPPDTAGNASLQFTYSRLEPRHLQWLQSLPASSVFDDQILLCHGTIEKDSEYLLEKITENGVALKKPDELLAAFSGIPQKIILCGHSHLPRTVYLEGGYWIINPGSVGLQGYTDDLPYPHVMACGNPLAKYCILELDKNHQPESIRHIEVPYDWSAAAEIAGPNGRPDWVPWLKSGRDE